ncbi:LOW QUALITY PROTEIN: uncharacterized protein Dana_GF27332 [Drosophila ananassae]|uniref:Uncharacterized protein n=1 Tax=Drosophila ananassae TaxID=7217 RepID=A0A0P8XWV5_DROAN|nr:LOW QUALITY PROTEIN: uncharacterized protein Dana_GF27332 [Drosophila ananassae]
MAELSGSETRRNDACKPAQRVPAHPIPAELLTRNPSQGQGPQVQGRKLTSFWTSVRACDLCARFSRTRATSVGGNGNVSGEARPRQCQEGKAHAQRPAGRTSDIEDSRTLDSGQSGVGSADVEQMLIVLISRVRRKHAAKHPIEETRQCFRHIDATAHWKKLDECPNFRCAISGWPLATGHWPCADAVCHPKTAGSPQNCRKQQLVPRLLRNADIPGPISANREMQYSSFQGQQMWSNFSVEWSSGWESEPGEPGRGHP